MSQLSFLSRVFGAAAAPSTHEIPRGAICRIDRPAGWRVTCIAGSVWVTQDRDPRDIMLEAGEHCRITGEARVLVQALEPARVSLTPTPDADTSAFRSFSRPNQSLT